MVQKSQPNDVWATGAAYEPYVGRWSRLVAREFLAFLGVSPAKQWLDIGCGTGALSQVILDVASPSKVKGEVSAIDVPTVFREFNDYWKPFLGGQGPAPTYAMTLSEDQRVALREEIRTNLPIATDGSIHLIARAWAIRGISRL